MSPAVRRWRVLVAEDSLEVARRISELLEEFDVADVVGVARDGREALERHAELRPDAAIVDIRMPRVDGIEVVRRIRASGDDCLLIVLSGLTEPSFRERCLAAGADAVLDKASESQRVIEILRRRVPGGAGAVSARPDSGRPKNPDEDRE